MQGYADDLLSIARGKFEGALYDLVQKRLNATRDGDVSVNDAWTEIGQIVQHGININPGKTTLIQFTRKRGLPNIKGIRME